MDNNIKINYMEYIEKQIMKPVCQIYGLIIEHLDKKWKFPHPIGYYEQQYKKTIRFINKSIHYIFKILFF